MIRSDSTRGALGRGLLTGVAGTAVMTAAQTAYYKMMDVEPSATPAEVGTRIIRGVLQREISDDASERLNTTMHWLYGTGWGALYGAIARRPTLGLTLGVIVWSASLVELPAMQLSPPLWKLPPSSIAPDLGFHLVYGSAVAAAHRLLTR